MYNHACKAGNAADMVKHDLLIAAAKEIDVKTYFESHCGYAEYQTDDGTWKSSWLKVKEHTKCVCILCDINPDVRKSVKKQSTENIFSETYGFNETYKQLRLENSPDLIFIDPDYTDPNDYIAVKDLIKIFNNLEKLQHWIIWYPLIKNTTSPMHMNNTNFGIEFVQSVSLDKKMYGCGMIFGGFNLIQMVRITQGMNMLKFCLNGSWKRNNF